MRSHMMGWASVAGVVLLAGCSALPENSRFPGRESLTPDDLAACALFGDPEGLRLLAPPHYVELNLWDTPQRGDVYVTWYAYAEWHGPRYAPAALYVWNGEPVGRGEKGYEEILRRMAKLRPGSRVLLYPYILLPLWVRANSRGGWSSTPLSSTNDRRRMDRVVVDRDLQVILSPFDHTGRVHPDAEDFWHYRWTADCERYDAWFTMRNSSDINNREETVYIWEGREVGKGLDGFVEILSLLEQLKPGSRVIVFVGLGEPCPQYDIDLLDEVVRRRNLIILYWEKEPPPK